MSPYLNQVKPFHIINHKKKVSTFARKKNQNIIFFLFQSEKYKNMGLERAQKMYQGILTSSI